MGLFGIGKKEEEGKSEVAKIRSAYETALRTWEKLLHDKTGKYPPEVLGENNEAHDQLEILLNTANKNGQSWDYMISLAEQLKSAADEHSRRTNRWGYFKDAEVTVNLLKNLKAGAEEGAEEGANEAVEDNAEVGAEEEAEEGAKEEAELGGGRRKSKSKKVKKSKKSKKSKKPKRSRRGKKQIKKTKKYKKRSNKKI